MGLELPNNTHHTTIVGMTGSGKTVMGCFLLSRANYTEQPWVIVDYKRDELLNSIPYIKELSLDEMPKSPGIYIIHPLPHQEDAMEDFLWRAWSRGRIGLVFDEGFMTAKSRAKAAIMMQGRSKEIPTITMTQRPVNLDRTTFSEASYFCIYHLNDKRDEDTVRGFVRGYNRDLEMDKHHSQWWDVKQRKIFNLQPVPHPDILLSSFEEKLKPKRGWL